MSLLCRKNPAGWLWVFLLITGFVPFNAPLPGPAAANATPTPGVVTVTPRQDGCTVHVVGQGQTLWSIALAYGIKVDDIRVLNGIPADSTTIYAGQKLVIRCATATPTTQASPTSTVNKAPARPAVTPTPVLQAPVVTRTGALAATPTIVSAAASGPPTALIAGLLILVGGTLIVLLSFALIRRR